MNVRISNGNSKMGKIPSVSLPAGLTCRPDCKCMKKCYARKLERLRPNVRNAYRANYDLLINDNETYWREVEASIMMSRFFRFHVSGDILNEEYFSKMVEVSKRNKQCKILCFTKKYEIVNNWIKDNGDLPDNLQIVFSAWKDMKMDNPYDLPEAHVLFKDGTRTFDKYDVMCEGNCTKCAITDGGCWTLKNGEKVVFNEH